MPFGANQGLSFLNSIQKMQQPGGGLAAGAGGAPNFMENGFLAKLMSGNPGGLIGAIANRNQAAPGQPGAPAEGPIAPGAPAMLPGGGVQPMGLLQMLQRGIRPPMGPQAGGMMGMGGGSMQPIPGDIGGA